MDEFCHWPMEPHNEACRTRASMTWTNAQGKPVHIDSHCAFVEETLERLAECSRLTDDGRCRNCNTTCASCDRVVETDDETADWVAGEGMKHEDCRRNDGTPSRAELLAYFHIV